MTRHWVASLLIILQVYNAALGVEYDRALFVKSDDIRKARELHTKVSQIAPNSMDQTVDHILTWLQTRYQQNQRSVRQDSEQQRPRPFVSTQPQEFRGYLPPLPPPNPEFPLPTTPPQSSTPNQFFQTTDVSESTPATVTGVTDFQSSVPGFQQQSQIPIGGGYQQQPQTSVNGGFQQQQPQILAGNGFQQQQPQTSVGNGFQQQQPQTSVGNGFQQQQPQTSIGNGFLQQQPQTSVANGFQQQQQPQTSGNGFQANVPTAGVTQQTQFPTGGFTQQTQVPTGGFQQQTQVSTGSFQQQNQDVPTAGFTQQTTGFTDEPNGFLVTNPPFQSNSETLQANLDDVVHPPHIHEMNVQCSKDMMTINVEFNKPYDGVIYSKGFYNSPECRYVTPNSGQTKYSFKVMLNSCGTHFVDEFSTGKQAYLENVLVVQNEPGIQEVWDVIRTVRCLWEGNLNKALSIALNIGMLNQEVVTFSGDTATARLDIQAGKGPFAPVANGLVKIGETMTLVVTVDGDPGFNILVRECVARDNNPESGNQLQLTDAQGCVAKPKLFGSFQTTNNPATGSLIAYAYFQAFKFPDVMDLLIECNVELCKVNCQPCSESNQKIDPGRRRRDLVSAANNGNGDGNNTINASADDDADSMMLIGRVHVYSPDDLLSDNGDLNRTATNDLLDPLQSFVSSDDRTLCISSRKFYMTYSFMVAVTLISSAMSMVLWIRLQRKSYKI